MKSKLCELDTMSTKSLKDIPHVIISTITQLINISLKTGISAKDQKEAVIRPLLKKITLELVVNNYRPVSHLNFLSNILAKLS